MRRPLLAVLAGLLVAAAGAGVLALQLRAAPATASGSITLGTARVVRTDIVSHLRVAGILGYGPESPVLAPAGDSPSSGDRLAGTVTWLPPVGARVAQGQVLYRVSDRPAVLLYGGHPDWRRLAPGVTGQDVVQLEDDLIALGYASTATLHDDGIFTSADGAAVARFQAALGVVQTGSLAAGEIVFEPGPVRVTALPVPLGAPLPQGGPVLQVTGTNHLVTIQLDASRQGIVQGGDAVSVLLPDGTTTVNGHLLSVSRVANQPPANNNQGGPPQSATVDATVSLDDESKAGTLDLAPVYVSIAAATHKGVLAVPVIALLAQPDGSYAVSVTGGGARRTVTVQPGLFGDGGLVEVSGGGLSAGDLVVVPAR
jgi:peptidoglycan hydrolase-like protein with peptidoglycan-binding domain